MRSSKIMLATLCIALGIGSGFGCGIFQYADTTAWTQRPISNSAAVRPTAVQVADFDGDGKLDIVAAYAGAGTTNPAVFILFQTDPNTFTLVQIASSTDLAGVTALAIGDLDSDGNNDVVAACNGRLVYLHSPANPRQGTGWVMSTIDQSSGAGFGQWNDVAIADIDGLNGPDIIACNGNVGRLAWFKSPATRTSGTGWIRTDIDITRAGAASVAIDDVDGDGRNDIISTAPGAIAARVAWYKNPVDPVGGTWTKYTIGNATAATRLALGDLDRDGLRDVVVTDPTDRTVVWYKKPTTPTGVWVGYQLAQYSSATPSDVKVADVNADGQPDVIVATQAGGTLRWFSPIGPATQGWGENNLADLTSGVFRIAIGDVDADNRLDVIAPLQAATTDQDTITWFENPF